MSPKMQVVCAQERFPDQTVKSIFLAGPTPRDVDTPSWRPKAIELLRQQGFDGFVFAPEVADGQWRSGPDAYLNQVSWEEEALHRADCILFWVPREMEKMPALITNVEWGTWADSGKVVLGSPSTAVSMRYLRHYAEAFKAPCHDTLAATVAAAIEMVGAGALRSGGECDVPLHVWKHPTFQSWYASQTKAGNRLDSARVLWTFRVGPARNVVFAWVLHVDMFITSENRSKTNEFVFGRTDVSSVVLYRRPDEKGSRYLHDTEIVLAREFRSPGRTPDGFVYDLPGGSSSDVKEKALSVAVHEVEEEIGFTVDPNRLTSIGSLQLAATLSAHAASLFSLKLTAEEMASIKATAALGQPHGVLSETERTYVEVRTIEQILRDDLVDWSTIGMIMTAILND